VKLLLTSSGIANTTIHEALVGLLGKPIEESSALVIPTAIYPFPGGADHAWEALSAEGARVLSPDWVGSLWEC
jgi:dipeptidase E